MSLRSRVLDMLSCRSAVEDRRGFVLPVIVFGLMLMGAMTVAALLTAGDEGRSGRAMREATGAFYAAEAGLNWVYANWDTVKADVDTLSGGSSFDLGWRSLDNGDSYRAVIHRWDEGGQPIYQLVVEGRSGGELGSQKRLSYTLTAAASGGGEAYKLGECCDATVTVRGDVDVTHSGSTLDGRDEHPGGCGTGGLAGFCYDWAAADVCSDSLYDKPAIAMQDTTLFYWDGSASLLSDPVVVQEPGIDNTTFNQFGDLSWDSLRALADHVIGEDGGSTEYVGEIYPRYTIDPMTGELLCDKSHPLNWGSPDPNDPCFNYFPIVLVKGDFAYEDSYGQAIVIMDYDNVNMRGTEFDLEDNSIFNGIVLGKGCFEVQYEAQFHGAIFMDGNYLNDLCSNDKTFDLNKEGHVTFSQCAVDRALLNTGLAEYAEPQVPGEPGGVQFLGSHSFGEGFR
ncbi:MAG: hypothetical protein GTO46_06950 [Gemmatimonadetes bacterium]|nr:hypothetical protein [Gemmatimonadota bacterium]NIO31367.1 hypothetical protein [Gemmatimonadota bacterium]